MTAISLTAQETQLLHATRAKADELARLTLQCSEAGFTVQFNINAVNGSCDIFNVFKMVPVDMRAGAN